ncbi:MAG: SGNH/GDSL hydrolase family protein [bacterium]
MKNNFKKRGVFPGIRVREIIFSVITFVLFILLLEGVTRSFYLIKNKAIPRESNFSKYLGWETAANISVEKKHKGYGKIKFSTTKWGFRIFGDTNTSKTKIFVIGDSITQANTVSDGNTYYDFLKNKNTEIFAYGCGGYGSLQEYMVLDKFFDIIKPDIILWQFSSNDIINNDYSLESASNRNNNHMRRPYYKDGQIEYLYPKQSYSLIYKLVRASYFLRLFKSRLHIVKEKMVGSIEDELHERHPLFQKSVNTTSEIMKLVKKRTGSTPIIAFSAFQPEWLGNAFPNICEKTGIYYVSGIPELITKAKNAGIVIDGTPYNCHWNSAGHSIVGEIIYGYLIRKNLLTCIIHTEGIFDESVIKEKWVTSILRGHFYF